ncbi:MAG: prepilin peptidase [Elusimicrobia bacterium]|nr:prepilin peptidase [Elusimicrobiota bacterium]
MKFFSLSYLAVFSVWAVTVINIDLATNKIPNVRIALGAKLLLLALGLHMLNTYLGGRGAVLSYLNWNFYWLWCAHIFWAVLAAVILWYSEIWPAGDAKFFMLTAAWLPLINPFIKNFPNYLFLSLLINIFVAAALAAIGGFLASGVHRAGPADFFRELSGDVKKRFAELAGENKKNKWLIPAYAANLTFLFLLQQILCAEAGRFMSGLVSRTELMYFFLFFLWDKIGGAFKSKKWLYAVTFCYILYFFAGYFYFHDRLAALVLHSLVNVFKFSMLLFFGRFLLEFLMEKKDAVYVGPGELQTGMILSAGAARTLKANPAFEGAFDDCFRDGISEEQLGLIREWLKKLPVQDPRVEMVKGRPFALWIFAGAAISLIFDKTAVKLLK